MPKLSHNAGPQVGPAQIPNAQIGFVFSNPTSSKIGFVPSFSLCEPLPPAALSAVNRQPNRRIHPPKLNTPNHFQEIGFVPTFRLTPAASHRKSVFSTPAPYPIGFVPNLCDLKTPGSAATWDHAETGFRASVFSPSSPRFLRVSATPRLSLTPNRRVIPGPRHPAAPTAR
jgi:hypothetical protein